MSIGLLFWILWVLWLVFGFIGGWGPEPYRIYWAQGSWIFPLILFFLLGWKIFGFVIHE